MLFFFETISWPENLPLIQKRLESPCQAGVCPTRSADLHGPFSFFLFQLVHLPWRIIFIYIFQIFFYSKSGDPRGVDVRVRKEVRISRAETDLFAGGGK